LLGVKGNQNGYFCSPASATIMLYMSCFLPLCSFWKQFKAVAQRKLDMPLFPACCQIFCLCSSRHAATGLLPSFSLPLFSNYFGAVSSFFFCSKSPSWFSICTESWPQSLGAFAAVPPC
uniref:Uncharacterized protein n=1 Tax=Chelonoidis abingdonii TaxID=106734 RepID=A0A8C0GB07_CHEAB